jgi:hypothetical protein
MTTNYQIIILGSKNSLIDTILETLFKHIRELGIKKESLIIINEINFKIDYKPNAPAFCLYFGINSIPKPDIEFIEILLKDATIVLPIVEDLNSFGNLIPDELKNINGFELSSSKEIEKLVSCVLEGLSLLRLSRRLFISYKRNESSTVAIQLFEKLERNGFDVFLDTHSIRPGEPFQEELWHRMADTDVVVLLNTPGFLKSDWTTQELAKANVLSIGILQLIWPTHNLEREAELSIPFQLSENDFGNKIFNDSKSYLTESTMDKIVDRVESLRARKDNIVTEFITSANKLGFEINLQPEKFITLKLSNNDDIVIIPTIGVPQAFTYNQSEDLVILIKSKKIKAVYILYDHRNIREKWIKHLAWLDLYLPIKTIKIVEAEKWLEKI